MFTYGFFRACVFLGENVEGILKKTNPKIFTNTFDIVTSPSNGGKLLDVHFPGCTSLMGGQVEKSTYYGRLQDATRAVN